MMLLMSAIALGVIIQDEPVAPDGTDTVIPYIGACAEPPRSIDVSNLVKALAAIGEGPLAGEDGIATGPILIEHTDKPGLAYVPGAEEGLAYRAPLSCETRPRTLTTLGGRLNGDSDEGQ